MTVDKLEALLGDPREAGNPVGYQALLASDERQEVVAEGERLLDRFGLNAEFVPVAHGGRLRRADHLADILRTVWRRDPALGLGYGFASLIASMNVWSSGSEAQRQQAAKLLLSGRRIAAGFHELDHGNDFMRAEFSARPTACGWSLSGRKEVVTNLRRAEAMVLFARTSPDGGPRGYSQFLVSRDELPADRVHDLPRLLSSGMRGVQLGAARFDEVPVSADALIGEPGQGVEIALRSYQVTRAVFPTLALGPLDTALRLATEFALERRLYGGVAADIPYVRSTIARAYADLTAIDAFAAVVLRALHLMPEAMAVYAPAAKYLTSRILLDAFEDLRSVLGAQAYLREGSYAMFQKLARDAAPATFAHISRAACLVLLLPQLPRLARKSWLTGPSAADPVFDVGGELPDLRLDLLTAGLPSSDGVMGALVEIATGTADTDSPEGRFAGRFLAELRSLRAACASLAPADLTIDASPAAHALADRYTVVLGAACAMAVWREGKDRYPRAAFLGALDRPTDRLGGPPVLTATEREHLDRELFDLVVERCSEHRLLDLTGRPIAGRARKDRP